MTSLFLKDPDANLDYTFDWTEWLGAAETISAVVFTVSSGITKGNSSNTDTTATVWITGGTIGNIYSVACKITTTSGRIDERSIRISVKER